MVTSWSSSIGQIGLTSIVPRSTLGIFLAHSIASSGEAAAGGY